MNASLRVSNEKLIFLIDLENGKFANLQKDNPDSRVKFIRSRNIPRA